MADEYLEHLLSAAADLVARAALLSHELREAPHADFDLVVRDVGREVCRLAAQVVAGDLVAQAVAAGRAEGLNVERSPKGVVTTLFGSITVCSTYLYAKGAGGRNALNVALGVRLGGRTRALERVLVDFGLDSSFETASGKVKEHYGLDIHRTTVRRTVLHHGKNVRNDDELRRLDAEFARPHHGKPDVRVLAEMDGSCVRTGALVPSPAGGTTPRRGLPKRTRTTQWRDLRLGFVRRLDDDAADKRFVGGIAELRDVALLMKAEAESLGWAADSFAVRVTDGGHGVREALDAVFPTGQAILDKPHLVHHLHETAEASLGASGPVTECVARWAAQISAGDSACVIRDLRAIETGRGVDRARQMVGYLLRFADATHYDAYVADGLPIGSGEVESAHKSQVQVRMKLPGTWWTVANANNLMAIRLLRANGRWDEFWSSRAA